MHDQYSIYRLLPVTIAILPANVGNDGAATTLTSCDDDDMMMFYLTIRLIE